MRRRKPGDGAERYQFQGNVTNYDDRYLVCRDTGHRWQIGAHWTVAYGARGRAVEYRRDVPCETCGTVRHDCFDGNMRPLQPSYSYSRGYVTAKTVERIDAAAARLEQVRRYGTDMGPRRLRAMGEKK